MYCGSLLRNGNLCWMCFRTDILQFFVLTGSLLVVTGAALV